jgi:hypothetical protein
LLEGASRANIAATRVFARGVVAAVATRLAPSRAARLALRAVLDNRSDIARRVFSYDEVVAMSPQTRVSLYCHSMMVVLLILLVGVVPRRGLGHHAGFLARVLRPGVPRAPAVWCRDT